jgi:hypothetical protein
MNAPYRKCRRSILDTISELRVLRQSRQICPTRKAKILVMPRLAAKAHVVHGADFAAFFVAEDFGQLPGFNHGVVSKR